MHNAVAIENNNSMRHRIYMGGGTRTEHGLARERAPKLQSRNTTPLPLRRVRIAQFGILCFPLAYEPLNPHSTEILSSIRVDVSTFFLCDHDDLFEIFCFRRYSTSCCWYVFPPSTSSRPRFPSSSSSPGPEAYRESAGRVLPPLSSFYSYRHSCGWVDDVLDTLGGGGGILLLGSWDRRLLSLALALALGFNLGS